MDLKSIVRKDVQVRILPPLPPLEHRRVTRKCFKAYSHLLGLYLRDGYINRAARTYRLHIYLHRDDHVVIGEAVRAIRNLRPGHPVGFRRKGAMTIVNAYYNGWPRLFPQHGPGHEHERLIALDGWQREIVT